MSSETTTQMSTKHRCKSKGCDNPVRMRPFKGSKKLYPEGKCGICMSTWRRYRMTGPERDEYVAKGGVLQLVRKENKCLKKATRSSTRTLSTSEPVA